MNFEQLLKSDPWIALAGIAAVAVVGALIAKRLVHALLLRLTHRFPILRVVTLRCSAPGNAALPLIALQAVWQAAGDDVWRIGSVRQLNALLLIAALTWLAVRALAGVADGVALRHPTDVADNLAARRLQTMTRLLTRSAMVVVVLIGIAMMLMTFPGARQVGASLLASAGVAGIVAGIAARPVFSNIISGLQIALAQPFRIDDVLIVEGEWGRVEEITMTYVVLKIWDERRLIIPLQWFIENPFQNWTRASSQIIGTVMLRVDYRMPLQPLRDEAQRACEAAVEWDRRLCLLQVTEADDHGIQLRVLVTSANASLSWDLRCKVREALVDFMQRDYPAYLPRLRAEVEGLPMSSPAAESLPPVRA